MNRDTVLLCRCLVSVTQVTTMREIQAHQTLMRCTTLAVYFILEPCHRHTSHDSLVDLEVGRTATQCLYVDTPLRWI
jgi:hypothetical protein